MCLLLLQLAVSAADDLYLEDTGSGGYPEDDDDFSSGSGSGERGLDEHILHGLTYSTLRCTLPYVIVGYTSTLTSTQLSRCL